MAQFRYEMQRPRENLIIDTFAHEIMNYRYHWHSSDYELNILLHGSQEFCRNTEIFTLKEDDVLLVSPGIGHASFGQEPNTRALVLHFSTAALRPYMKKGTVLHFPSCQSTDKARDNGAHRLIRFCAAQIYSALSADSPYASLSAKAGVEMLLSVLCQYFAPQVVPYTGDEQGQQELVRHMITYIESHYAEKLSLEDLAAYTQYNRTYVSTLFKNTVGVGFYEYLTRLRFQHALLSLVATDKNLTDVALENGFPDLKSFNKRFKETFGRSPSEYRAMLDPERVIGEMGERHYISPDDELVQKKINEYLHLQAAALKGIAQ